MAYTTNKTLNVRIKNKYDSYENWASAGVILEAGEIAIAYTTVDVKEGNGIVKHPALLMKVGDGSSTFANLPWLSAKAADVADWAKAEAKPVYAASEITGIADYIADYVSEEMGIEVDTDTQYQIVANGTNGFKLQSKGKGETAWADVVDSTFTVDFSAVTGRIDGIDAKLSGINSVAEELAKYDTTEVSEGKIKVVSDALAEYKEANDDAVTANADAIDAITKDATIKTFKGIEDTIAGMQETAANYATKTEAQGYANAKDAAIQAAQKAGDNAQAGVNALNAKVNLDEGETVKGLIDAAKGEAISTATAHVEGVNGRLDGIDAKLAGVGNIAEELAKYDTTEVSEEKIGAVSEALETYKTTNDARVKAIEDDYLTSADKTSLQEQINLIIENPDVEGVKNSINEFTQYIKDHGEIAEGFRTDINKNKEDIAAIAADYLVEADKTEFSGLIGGLDTRLGVAEGEIDGLQADMLTKADKAAFEAAAAKLPSGTVAEFVAGQTAPIEERIDGIEENLADIATTGNVDDLVQTENTYIVFDCGTASTII